MTNEIDPVALCLEFSMRYIVYRSSARAMCDCSLLSISSSPITVEKCKRWLFEVVEELQFEASSYRPHRSVTRRRKRKLLRIVIQNWKKETRVFRTTYLANWIAQMWYIFRLCTRIKISRPISPSFGYFYFWLCCLNAMFSFFLQFYYVVDDAFKEEKEKGSLKKRRRSFNQKNTSSN